MMWDDSDFSSDDPFVRYNAHQAAKGRSQLPDPDEVRKYQKEFKHPLYEQWLMLKRDSSTRMTFEEYCDCTEKR